jgi:eukaryotic-like serine/threonine-protein kinase
VSYEGTIALNYRLERKLGEGGFGAVYLARHVELGRKVACKILHREWAGKPEVVDRFFREARSVCEIGHRAIIEIENFGRLPDGEPFYLMEFFAGESLGQRIRRSPVRASEAITVFAPVASALAAAHAKQIVHRDLKPENIMVLEDAGSIVDVKLLDFGIAKLVGDADAGQSRSGTALGTPAFMAPEQARDSKSVDARADVYSFAATVFAAFAGRAPFEGDSVASVLVKVQLDPPAKLGASAPAGLQRVLERCMDKDPARRPRTILDAWNEIAQILGATADPGGAGVAVTLAPDAPTGGVAATLAPGAVTTLGAASGQTAATKPGRRRWPYLIVAACVVAGAAIALIVSRGPANTAAGTATTADRPTTEPRATTNPSVPASDTPPPTSNPSDTTTTPSAPTNPSASDARGTQPPPDAASPPRVVELQCSEASFATESASTARTALKRLEQCLKSNRVPRDRYDRLREDLVAVMGGCSPRGFARVYDAAAPSVAEIERALVTLRGCRNSGALRAEATRVIEQRLAAKRPAPEPAAPPTGEDCSAIGFSNLVDKPDATSAELEAAIARLKRCKPRLPADRFTQLQQNLVSRWLKQSGKP